MAEENISQEFVLLDQCTTGPTATTVQSSKQLRPLLGLAKSFLEGNVYIV